MFGMGGKSYIELLDKDKQEGDFTISGFGEDTYFGADIGAIGLTYSQFFNERSMQALSVAASAVQNKIKVDSLYNNGIDKFIRYGQKSLEEKFTITYNFNSKINSQNTVSAGLIADLYVFKYGDSVWRSTEYLKLTGFHGDALLWQAYAKWQHRFNDKLALNTGIHFQEFLLNNTIGIEPRIGLKWNLASGQSLSFGTGMHSQTQPMRVYFYETRQADGTYVRTNKDLGFSKSTHYVIAYDNNFARNWRTKIESYYQHLYNIATETQRSSYSVLNLGANYVIPDVSDLKNNGTGTNYGIELTLEKFLSKNYYMLLTGSLYEAKYTGSDGVERNSAFNGNYTLNTLLGGEFNLDKKKRKVITFNTKINYAGGKHYTAFLLDESRLKRKAIYDEAHAYENQYPFYSRVDVKVGFKLNGKKLTQEWSFDIQNILNRKNVFQQLFNPVKGEVQTEFQLGFFPLVTYRILL